MIFKIDTTKTHLLLLKCQWKSKSYLLIIYFLANASMKDMFSSLRNIQPKGPLVNSELYVGWITYWGKEVARTDIQPIVETINKMMKGNISFSMYMLHGGSNFGFTAGE